MSQDIAHQAAKILLETQSVLFNATEPFQYTSGNRGPVYIDCRRPLSFPAERHTLMSLAVTLLSHDIGHDNIDLIAGAETAGIPYGVLIADRLKKPFIYVRKKPKGHGRMNQIEGYFPENSSPRVVLTEDLQNFGHSKHVFIKALRDAGVIIDHFFVLFDYGIRPDVVKDNEDMKLTQHALCNWHDILTIARQENYFDIPTLQSVESYLNNPDEWMQLQYKDSVS